MSIAVRTSEQFIKQGKYTEPLIYMCKFSQLSTTIFRTPRHSLRSIPDAVIPSRAVQKTCPFLAVGLTSGQNPRRFIARKVQRTGQISKNKPRWSLSVIWKGTHGASFIIFRFHSEKMNIYSFGERQKMNIYSFLSKVNENVPLSSQ